MGFLRRKSREERELRQLVGEDAQLPTMPGRAVEILQLLRDPDSSARALAECLQWDPGLVVRVLRLANSATSGASTRIEELPHAITFLGRSNIEQLVLAVTLHDGLPAAPAPGFEPDRFWRTAAFRASLARALAERLHPARATTSFLAGLLQDMAIPVLAHAQPERYGGVLEAWHGEARTPLSEIERAELGWTHADVGALLARMWELPPSLASNIGRHHERGEDDYELPPAVRLVAILREKRANESLDQLLEEARGDYGLAPDEVRTLVEECRWRAVELAAGLAR